MELIEEQRMRETARAFAVDLYRDDNFMEAASFDPQSTLVYGIESGYINGYKAALAAAAEREKVLVEALESVKASWTNNDPLCAQHILQINDALASAKLLA